MRRIQHVTIEIKYAIIILIIIIYHNEIIFGTYESFLINIFIIFKNKIVKIQVFSEIVTEKNQTHCFLFFFLCADVLSTFKATLGTRNFSKNMLNHDFKTIKFY